MGRIFSTTEIIIALYHLDHVFFYQLFFALKKRGLDCFSVPPVRGHVKFCLNFLFCKIQFWCSGSLRRLEFCWRIGLETKLMGCSGFTVDLECHMKRALHGSCTASVMYNAVGKKEKSNAVFMKLLILNRSLIEFWKCSVVYSVVGLFSPYFLCVAICWLFRL